MSSVDSDGNSAQSVKRKLKLSTFTTPPTSFTKTRKRKSLSQYSYNRNSLPVRKLSDVLEMSQEIRDDSNVYKSPISDTSLFASCESENSIQEDLKSCCSGLNHSIASNLSFNFDQMQVSSPINNSHEDIKLSYSLERCTLNYEQNGVKRFKSQDEKASSAPNTPVRITEPETSIKKYNSVDFTPTKPTRKVKIGTPERNEILYPELIKVKPPSKSPIKRSRTAAKRLFERHDFIYLFTQRTNNREIICKIFSYLNESDLVSVSKVSKLWRKVVHSDVNAWQRYKIFVKRRLMSKENYYKTAHHGDSFMETSDTSKNDHLSSALERSYFTSPAKDKFDKFVKLARMLQRSQSLTHCPECLDAAILEKNVAECTRLACQYFWCNRCKQGSKLGPKHFNCLCSPGNSPPRSQDKSLTDLSNVTNSSFFTDRHYFQPQMNLTSENSNHPTYENYYNVSSSLNETNNSSSGYFSQSDIERSTLNNNHGKVKPTVLKNLNKSLENNRKGTYDLGIRHVSLKNVVVQRRRQRKESNEPSSPPQVESPIIGSKKCKKNLRRLLF